MRQLYHQLSPVSALIIEAYYSLGAHAAENMLDNQLRTSALAAPDALHSNIFIAEKLHAEIGANELTDPAPVTPDIQPRRNRGIRCSKFVRRFRVSHTCRFWTQWKSMHRERRISY